MDGMGTHSSLGTAAWRNRLLVTPALIFANLTVASPPEGQSIASKLHKEILRSFIGAAVLLWRLPLLIMRGRLSAPAQRFH